MTVAVGVSPLDAECLDFPVTENLHGLSVKVQVNSTLGSSVGRRSVGETTECLDCQSGVHQLFGHPLDMPVRRDIGRIDDNIYAG